ncbi:hypothetical protein Y032_0026g1299 [Ancylostoma ceylanicum]|uniref:Uncharacterized protein n=1 Tax=Ancylostoma ceylanicum TaxID=53326 RepID=A0A016UW29_9BILA|nr:hypothetical protein Y032_0026g1299 [Ancylostoma ceylanicum]
MDKVNEETPDERGMIIKGAWQSIGIVSTIATLASPFHYGHFCVPAMGSVWQRSMVDNVAIDTYHFRDPNLLYRQFILIHFELAKSGDTHTGKTEVIGHLKMQVL